MGVIGGMSREMWLSRDEASAETSLQHQVWDELHDVPLLSTAALEVEAAGYTVTLTGTVDSYPAKLAAEAAARSVPGVGDVSSKIVVAPSAAARRVAAELETAAGRALEWDVRVPPGRVVARVAHGHVTLRGIVEHAFERDAAEEAVRSLLGVTDLTNAIALAGRETAVDLEASVERILRQHARPFHRRLRADVRDGTVVLRGHVRTLAERVETERAVQALPGVRHVVDHLEVVER
jgi:osmotically-inducible protein OsmY